MMPWQGKEKLQSKDVAAVLFLAVAALGLSVLRAGITATIPYLLITLTTVVYLLLLYQVHRVLQKKPEDKNRRNISIALALVEVVSIINLAIFRNGFQGGLLALSLLLLIMAVVLLYLLTRYR